MRLRASDLLRRACFSASLALATLGPLQANAASVVGTAGAANIQSTSIPPGGGLRVVEIGAQVVENEKIETSASGSVQLMFIDKTTLNIGPHSEVVIDKFVFNPVTAQGDMAITLTKGALRLVGGQVTHTGGAMITTPVAGVGVRGGIVTVSHSRDHGTRAYLGYGTITVTSRCLGQSTSKCAPQSVTASRPGFVIQASGGDAPPSQPAKAAAALVDQSNAELTSKSGQNGGSTTVPTDQLAVGYNVGTVYSVAAPVVVATQAQGRSSGGSNVYQIAQQGVQNSSANSSAQNTASRTTITSPTSPAPATVVSAAVNANTPAIPGSMSSAPATPCVCDYTRWGFWSLLGSRHHAVNNNIYKYGQHLGFWLAGVPTAVGSIPGVGAATYSGHAIAEIRNNGSQYVSAGTFTNAVNFATRSGTVAITGLDGANYSGTVNLTPATTQFGGTLAGNIGTRRAALAGTFFKGGPTNLTPSFGEMGGSINLTGTNYLGSGIFAARKP